MRGVGGDTSGYNFILIFQKHIKNILITPDSYYMVINVRKRDEEMDMEENKVEESASFEYTYSAEKQKEVEKIRKKYLPAEEDKMETLRKLDKSAEKPGKAIAIVMGVIGSLLLGIGMCCTMVWSGVLFVPGIAIGLLGIFIVACTYPVYIRITKKQRAKIAGQILELSKEICM